MMLSRTSIPMSLFLALSSLSIACYQPPVAPAADWRRGSGICDVHDRKMDTREVYGLAARIDPTEEYGEARATLFPNAGIDYGPEHYSDERGLIYVCTECEAAREQWLQEWNQPEDAVPEPGGARGERPDSARALPPV